MSLPLSVILSDLMPGENMIELVLTGSGGSIHRGRITFTVSGNNNNNINHLYFYLGLLFSALIFIFAPNCTGDFTETQDEYVISCTTPTGTQQIIGAQYSINGVDQGTGMCSY